MRLFWMCLLLAPWPAIAQEPALMPWPAQVEHRTGQLTFRAPLQLRVDGPTSERTTRGLERWSIRLAEKAGAAAMGDSRNGTPILIHYERLADLRSPDVDGSYTLAIDQCH